MNTKFSGRKQNSSAAALFIRICPEDEELFPLIEGILGKSTRPDDIVERKGDLIVAYLKGTHMAGVLTVANRIQEQVRRESLSKGFNGGIANIGISSSDIHTPDEILNAARGGLAEAEEKSHADGLGHTVIGGLKWS